MDRILEIDRENLVAVVQPGVINADLKAAVAAEGLFYPPDPASYEMCSIGGNLGTNAGGLCCVKYGQTRESVLSLEVVMADGTVIRTGGKNVKDVAGYSLTHLFVGSQGTLAITTEATLRLRPAPPPRSTMLAFFPTLDGAGDAVAGIAAAGLSPVTLELLDRFTIAAVDDMNDLGLDRTAAAMLMIESDLPGVAAADELERAEAACRVAGATDVVRAADAQEADWLRQARRAAHYALERLGEVRMEDVGVPRSRVPDMLREIERIGAKHDVRIGTFGHAGDGNLHPDLVFERGDPTAEAKTEAVKKDLYRAALDLGGTVTARARHRQRPARLARDPEGRRCDARDAGDQDRRSTRSASSTRVASSRSWSSAGRGGPYPIHESDARLLRALRRPERPRRLRACDPDRGTDGRHRSRPRSPTAATPAPPSSPPAPGSSASAPAGPTAAKIASLEARDRHEPRRRRVATRSRLRVAPADPRDRRPDPLCAGRGGTRRRAAPGPGRRAGPRRDRWAATRQAPVRCRARDRAAGRRACHRTSTPPTRSSSMRSSSSAATPRLRRRATRCSASRST